MKLLYLTNIPTPYRIARFNLLHVALREHGINLEVLFMAETEPNRSWAVCYSSILFDYKIYNGVHPAIFGMFAHFNPSLLYRLRLHDYSAIVIGGMACPTQILAPFFVRACPTRIMSVESNMLSTRIKTGIGAAFKRKLLALCNAYQITGERQREYVCFFYPQAVLRTFLTLPNIIDEHVFQPASAQSREARESVRQELGINGDEQFWVLPARLSAEKGILEFLAAVRNKAGFVLAILGDGPLAGEIQRRISEFHLPVRLLGFRQQQEVARYYSTADVFVLPSVQDPSPLSPIEAIRTGLPLLISSLVGNANEVCDNTNGIMFDPRDGLSIEAAVSSMISKTPEARQQMGTASRARYSAFFDAATNISRYSRELAREIKGNLR